MLTEILQWIGLTQPQTAGKTARKDAVSDFLMMTQMGSPGQNQAMGSLNGTIAAQDFARFCRCFADGVSYVTRHYGTTPKAILITDEESAAPRYNMGSQCIYLPRNFIRTCLALGDMRQSKTEPYVLTAFESATIYGIEEAYHHYQFTQNANYYRRLPLEVKPIGGGYTDGYDNHPLEYESEKVIRRAIIELGFDKRIYQMFPGTKPLNWCKKIEPQAQPEQAVASPAR